MKKKSVLLICSMVVVSMLNVVITGCKKDSENSVSAVTLNTKDVSNINDTSATCGGTITNDGGNSIIARGVCWSTSSSPTINSNKTIDGLGTGSFLSLLKGLSANTKYYLRAYATNINGTYYGDVKSFTTSQNVVNTVADIDGNVYHPISIGNQTWLAENLKTTKYCNGDPIPNISDNNQWNNLTSGAYCNYNNDISYENTYGHLYNLYVVMDTRNACPVGWHVPTDSDWSDLVTFLGGDGIAGGKLKEIGTTHWNLPNTGATNETGFTALPGGSRDYQGAFIQLGNNGHWWSSTKENSTSAWSYRMGSTYPNIGKSSSYQMNGYSIRCVKD